MKFDNALFFNIRVYETRNMLRYAMTHIVGVFDVVEFPEIMDESCTIAIVQKQISFINSSVQHMVELHLPSILRVYETRNIDSGKRIMSSCMATDTVQQIKDRLSIVDVVSQYVKLERSGQNMRARCPFHAEKTPSFFVSPDRGTYHCFGCNVGGDIFTFVQEIEGLDFKGALKVLAEKAGVEIVYQRGNKEQKDERERLFELLEVATIFYTSNLTDAAKKYLKERGMSDTTVKEFRLGCAGDGWTDLVDHLLQKSARGGSALGRKFTDKELLEAGLAKKNERGSLTDKFRNRIMFPIADSAGRVVGFTGRLFRDSPPAASAQGSGGPMEAPKYLNSPETPLFHKSKILYGFDRAKQSMRKNNCAVLVEGQMDLLASHQAGWANTVAVSGTAFTPDHAKLVRRMTDNLVIALDADEAGIKAAGRAARAALQGELNVKVAQLPTGSDPADLILKEGKDAWSKAIREAKDIITFLLDVLEEHAKNPDAFRRTVEAVVLPFLSDVASPIAREQYMREVARRLGVSESAVAQSYSRVPSAPRGDRGQEGDALPIRNAGKLHHAYAILIWQKSKPKPLIDVGEFEASLIEAAGKEAFEVLTKLPDNEKERLRFLAEDLYGKSTVVPREAQAVIKVIHSERLAAELDRATMALQKAELVGDEKEAQRQMGVSKMLTTEIAKLHEKG